VSRILRLRCSAPRQSLPKACRAVLITPLTIATPRPQAAAEQQGPSKTAISRLKVAQLRSQLLAVGLPADGLKPQLVERLLSFQRHQASDDDDETAQPISSSDCAEHHPDSKSHIEAAGGEDTPEAASLSSRAAGLDAERKGVQPASRHGQGAVSRGAAGTCSGHRRNPACEPNQRSVTKPSANWTTLILGTVMDAGACQPPAGIVRVLPGVPQQPYPVQSSPPPLPTGLAVQWLVRRGLPAHSQAIEQRTTPVGGHPCTDASTM